MKNVKKEELSLIFDQFTTEDKFSMTFIKADGTERTYNECVLGIKSYNPDAKRHGLTAKEHKARGNVLFYVLDEGKNSYRIAKLDKIKSVRHNGDEYIVVED